MIMSCHVCLDEIGISLLPSAKKFEGNVKKFYWQFRRNTLAGEFGRPLVMVDWLELRGHIE